MFGLINRQEENNMEYKFNTKKQKSIVELSGLELALIRQSISQRSLTEQSPELDKLAAKLSNAYWDLVNKRK